MSTALTSLKTLCRAGRRRHAHELNVVSLIDVMIVLVFFLLLQTIDITSLDIAVPGNQAARQVSQEPPLIIVAGASDLRATLGSAPVQVFGRQGGGYDLAGLTAWLERVKHEAPARTDATVLSTPGLAYGDLVPVLDAVRGSSARGAAGLFPDIALGDSPNAQGSRP
jgi:biopolymer transport protein ExbD